MTNKLYIEYRVYFHPQTNQELLHIVAEAAQERIYNLFDLDTDGQPLPSPHDVTYEIHMESDGVWTKVNEEQAEARFKRS